MNHDQIIQLLLTAAGLAIGSIATTVFNAWFRSRHTQTDHINEGLGILVHTSIKQNNCLGALIEVNKVALNGQTDGLRDGLSEANDKLLNYATSAKIKK